MDLAAEYGPADDAADLAAEYGPADDDVIRHPPVSGKGKRIKPLIPS